MYLCFSKIGILLPIFFHLFLLTVCDGKVRAHRSLHACKRLHRGGLQRGVWEWEQAVQGASSKGAFPDENFKTIINPIKVSLFNYHLAPGTDNSKQC